MVGTFAHHDASRRTTAGPKEVCLALCICKGSMPIILW